MATAKQKKTSRNKRLYPDPDDHYFRKHFARLVRQYGGQWIVLAEGKLIGIGTKRDISVLLRKAQTSYPNSIPFIAPIPSKEELECVL